MNVTRVRWFVVYSNGARVGRVEAADLCRDWRERRARGENVGYIDEAWTPLDQASEAVARASAP